MIYIQYLTKSFTIKTFDTVSSIMTIIGDVGIRLLSGSIIYLGTDYTGTVLTLTSDITVDYKTVDYPVIYSYITVDSSNYIEPISPIFIPIFASSVSNKIYLPAVYLLLMNIAQFQTVNLLMRK